MQTSRATPRVLLVVDHDETVRRSVVEAFEQADPTLHTLQAATAGDVREILWHGDRPVGCIVLSAREAGADLALCRELRDRYGRSTLILLRTDPVPEEPPSFSSGSPIIDGFISRDDVEGGQLRLRICTLLRHWETVQARGDLERRLLQQEARLHRAETVGTMAAGLAHDAATPIGVARTSSSLVAQLLSELVESGADGSVVDDLRASCGLIDENLARAEALVRGFMDLAVGQLSDRWQIVDLAELVHNCVRMMDPDLRKRDVRVGVTCLGSALRWRGYPGRLTQVLTNLLQNCVRYAYPDGGGGEVHIELSPGHGTTETPFHRIEVRDFGSGIAPELLPRVFDMFVTTGAGDGGTGLGLAMCKHVMTDGLHGDIRVASEPGRGTTFTLIIPDLARPEEARP